MPSGGQKVVLSAKVLKWARVTLFGSRVHEAAFKLKITEDQLKEWEAAGPEVSISQLKRMAKVYKRHVSVLLLITPPISLEPPKFRRLSSFNEVDYELSTFLAIRQAQEVQNTTIFLRGDAQNTFLEVLTKLIEDPYGLAKRVIELLSVSPDKRFVSKSSKEQLSIWKRIIGSAGIPVLEIGFSVQDARAFAIYNPVAPMIVLNSRDTDNARIFSLFHELCHLILRQTDVDKDLNLSGENMDESEVFCNAFSGYVLVPDDLLRESVNTTASFGEGEVKALANKFKVSNAVIWRRLYDLHFIGPTQYKKIRAQLSVFESFSEDKKKARSGGGRDTFLYTTMKRKSELFISEIFEAFNERRITYYDVLDYTGVKPKHIPRLERIMFA